MLWYSFNRWWFQTQCGGGGVSDDNGGDVRHGDSGDDDGSSDGDGDDSVSNDGGDDDGSSDGDGDDSVSNDGGDDDGSSDGDGGGDGGKHRVGDVFLHSKWRKKGGVVKLRSEVLKNES